MKLNLGNYAGSITDGRRADLDLDIILRSNLLIQAASGGGKSWALRRIAEQACRHVPVGIIDVEDEFASLREKHPFVLIGPGGETPADPRSAAMVATRMLELGTSFVANIFEMQKRDRFLWVKIFLETLVGAPKRLWREFLFLLDEAHMFAPEGGRGGKDNTTALDAVTDLAARGRKRGFGLICATQRLGKFNKDTAAELKNVLIGQTVLDIDRERAAETLGQKRDRKTKMEFYETIKMLEPGEFYALGRALTTDVSILRVGPVLTTHPEPGRRTKTAPPPPMSRVKRLLPQLKDLPQEAEQEAKTTAELKKKVRELQAQVHQMVGESARGPGQIEVEKIVEVEVRVEVPVIPTELHDQFRVVADAARKVDLAASELRQASGELGPERLLLDDMLNGKFKHTERVDRASDRASAKQLIAHIDHQRLPTDPSTSQAGRGKGDVSLGKGERKILIAIAMYSARGVAVVTTSHLTVLTGYKRSARDTYLSRLRQHKYIEKSSGGFIVTAAGASALGRDYEPLPTGKALREHYMMTLPLGERRILAFVVRSHPGDVTKVEIDEATSYKRSARDTYISRLNARQLIIADGGRVRAAEILFR